jgi:hypothetical protein
MTKGIEVVPSDTVTFPLSTIYVGGMGNVNIKTSAGNTVLFRGLQVGTILPLQAIQVLATDTTAEYIVRMW